MKGLSLRFIALFAFAALLFTSCEEDPIDDVINDVPPTISLSSDAGFIASSATINVGEAISVRVVVSPGSSDLATLTIKENGTNIPLDRLQGVVGNPVAFFGDTKTGTTVDVTILPDLSVTEESFFSYEFEVADDAGETSSTSVDIQIEIPFTNIEKTIPGALLNQAGNRDAGQGGLDLDDGDGAFNSNEEGAELQDEGIDLDIAVPNNWRRQISGANGTEVVFVDDLSKFTDVSTFDEIAFKEQIAAAFEGGAPLDGDDSACNCSDSESGEAVSQPVVVGDIFAVRRPSDGRTYLIECTAVNVTENNNADNYEFTIKY